MSTPANFRVFVSATSVELASYREEIARVLRRKNIEVREQKHFRQSGKTLLDTLSNYINECDAVICLIGDHCGSLPTDEHMAVMLDNEWVERFRTASGQSSVSYTQWEFLLAKSQNKLTYVYLTAEGFIPDDKNEKAADESATQISLQTKYRHWIQHIGEHWVPLITASKLIEDVLVLPFPDLSMGKPNNLLQDSISEKLDKLIRQSADKARELHLTEQLFISLAKRIATDVPDIDQAYRELEHAVDVASEEQARSALPANTDAAVTAILARVDELNNAGQIDEAATHLIEEEARIEAGLIRVYDKAIAQAVLTRNVDMACTYEIKKIAIEAADPAAQFKALRPVQDIWYERGRDKGLNFDLEVSIALARRGLERAGDADQRGAALNDLGLALKALGARESDPKRLHEAVAAYRAALKEWTRDRVPLDWAGAHLNLGTALSTLGERESDPQRLHEAVAAYRAALKEWTRDRVPLDWAMAQDNLGGAFQTLGERESDPQRLEEAVTAYRAALEERTRDRVPMDWASTQNSLGNALQRLGERESDPQRLHEAVAAYQAALREYTQDRVPLNWAATQNNLGGALYWLGERERDPQRLHEAVAAYRAALEEYTQDRVPLRWALTQNNLGGALRVLGTRETDPQRLDEAVAAYRAALEERKRDRVPLQWATTQYNLARAMVALANHSATTDPRSSLEAALEHVDAALEIFDADQSSYYHEIATRLREHILALLEQ